MALRKITAVCASLYLVLLGACAHTGQTMAPVWIDVRTPAEYASGHLETAANIPHTDIAERIREVVSDKDAEIHLYCGSGARAGMAQKVLADMGYSNVTNDGGYRDLVGADQESRPGN